MDTSRLPFVTRLATLSLLLSPILAQNDTTNPGGTNTAPADLNLCDIPFGDFNSDASINATGSVNIHWDALMMDPSANDWTITLTYNESRDDQDPEVSSSTMYYHQGYISAPNVTEARTCVTMFYGVNATSSSGQRNGCDGVLTDACTSFLSEVTFDEDCNLPRLDTEWTNMWEEACGADMTSPGFITTDEALEFSNKTCSVSNPPGSTSPENYRTFPAPGRELFPGGYETDDFDTWYDIYVQQTVPFIVSAQFSDGISETQVVCVAPKEVIEESDASGASLDWRSSGWTAIFVALAVSMVAMVT